MKRWNVTIPYVKRPWYKLTRIEAETKQLAIKEALAQIAQIDPSLVGAKHKKPIAKETI